MANTSKYTTEQVAEIKEVFSVSGNTKAKKELAKRLNRDVGTLYSKYRYETTGYYSKNKSKGKAKGKAKPTLREKVINVTHVTKPAEIQNATIKIGDAVITVFSPKVVVNGINIVF